MPIPVPDCPGVYHCGFHSEKSFGATSYLIVRPEGNILMDSPRFTPVLAKKFEAMGGVDTIVLSHMCASHPSSQHSYQSPLHGIVWGCCHCGLSYPCLVFLSFHPQITNCSWCRHHLPM